MKLITLNIWGGHVQKPLKKFFKHYSDVDIFCLQEVYHNAQEKISDDDLVLSLNIFNEIKSLLPEHQGFFKPVVQDYYGLAIFINKKLGPFTEGEVIIHTNQEYPGSGPTHSRNLQWVRFAHQHTHYTVANVHGLWNGMGKTDTAARIAQSMKIKQFLDSIDTRKIVAGDFNLRPDTESIKMLENGMRNLITEYEITSTRTSLYKKEERFADYVFTSPKIGVHDFTVLPDEVSDHSALLLDFD